MVYSSRQEAVGSKSGTAGASEKSKKRGPGVPSPKMPGAKIGSLGGNITLRDEKASYYGSVKQANEHERKVAVELDTSPGGKSHDGTNRDRQAEQSMKDGPPIARASRAKIPSLPQRHCSCLCWKWIKYSNGQII